ncbi:MAG: hypothetical protein RL609_990 [Bacteroidota bacterium]|jgi:hypothetical protein
MENNKSSLPPSMEEMKLWHQGTFPSGKRHQEIKRWFDENNFLQDAMAGLDFDPDFSGFHPTPTAPTASHKSHFKGWILGLVIGMGCAFLAVSLWNPLESTTAPIANNSATLSSQTAEQPNTEDPIGDIEKPSFSAKSTTPTTSQNSEKPSDIIEKESPAKPLPSKSGTVISNHATGLPLKKINLCIYIQGQEVYPYRERNQKENFSLPGLPADNGRSKENEITVGYLEFLESGIVAFQNQDMETALECSEIILKQFPKDINALYLKAKCIFASNRHLALEYFQSTLKFNQGRLNEKEIKEYIRLSQ